MHRAVGRIGRSTGRWLVGGAAAALVAGRAITGGPFVEPARLDSVAAAPAQDRVWFEQDGATDQTLRDVAALGSGIVWAVGGEGEEDCAIQRSEDGGTSWRQQGCPVRWKLQAMTAIDAQTAVAVGLNGTAIRTDNGGANWAALDVDTSQGLTDVYFIDAQRGWITTRNGGILRTTDGGASWRRSDVGGGLGLFGLSFVDAQRGWATGSDGLVLSTEDGGASWRRLPRPGDARLLAVRFLDATTGFACGNVILHTWDGGRTWAPRLARPEKTLNDMVFADGAHAWAVGDEGYIVRSVDGGASWVKVPADTGRSLTAVSFAGPDDGWAVGTGGVVVRWGIRPPTRTPSPTITRTPTATRTPTPTPSQPWLTIDWPAGVTFYAGAPDRARTVHVRYGNQPAPTVLTATLTGGLVFPNGRAVLTEALSADFGTLRFVLRTPPEVVARQLFELRVIAGGRTVSRSGRVPWSLWLPMLHRLADRDAPPPVEPTEEPTEELTPIPSSTSATTPTSPTSPTAESTPTATPVEPDPTSTPEVGSTPSPELTPTATATDIVAATPEPTSTDMSTATPTATPATPHRDQRAPSDRNP